MGGKVEALLAQRARVLEEIRNVCCTLVEANANHADYLRAFLREGHDAFQDGDGDDGDAHCVEQAEGEKRSGEAEGEGEDEEWPLKRTWIQVMFFKFFQVLVNRESRAVRRVVEERMREPGSPLTARWLRDWVIRDAVTAQASNGGGGGGGGGLHSVHWPMWKDVLLRAKILALSFARDNRSWLLRNMPSEVAPRTFGISAAFGTFAKVAKPNAGLAFDAAEEGGQALMLELGARAVTPRPRSAVALDLVLDPALGEEDRDGLLELVEELVDNLLDDELQQVPGYICTRAGILANTAPPTLRVSCFFTSQVDEAFWVASAHAHVRYWPAPESGAAWFLREKLELRGLLLEASATCRLVGSSLFGGSTKLEFASLRDADNPLHRWYRSLMRTEEDTLAGADGASGDRPSELASPEAPSAAAASRADLLVAQAVEALVSGQVAGLRRVQACSGERVARLVPTADSSEPKES